MDIILKRKRFMEEVFAEISQYGVINKDERKKDDTKITRKEYLSSG
jgi:hypothetical protein